MRRQPYFNTKPLTIDYANATPTGSMELWLWIFLWEIIFVNSRLTISAWDLSLGNIRLGEFALELRVDLVSLEPSLRTCALGNSVWDPSSGGTGHPKAGEATGHSWGNRLGHGDPSLL